ncbi:hypothetical protein F0562_035529 [Nyssa sinensis]|uniref:Uncharacterized protein n=1 Tax=Nyssa sinensis TaxID=561372 RepID=A0A5J5ACC9_9ASTE|nr:hypothetical protein F0562_035529 [Nyssa sinensis]
MTTTTAILLSIAIPHQLPQSQHPFNGRKRLSIHQVRVANSSFNPITPLCSSSTSASLVAEEEGNPSPPSDALTLQSESTAPQDSDSLSPLRGCKACGREEIEKGCNGEGRIQGGIATVPGFGWWPIKAYRPCPGFVASGGRYRRRGQSMDEVAFGRGETGASMGTSDEAKSK